MYGGAARQPRRVDRDVGDQLEKLEGMRDRGTLTPEEFEAQKRKLLGLDPSEYVRCAAPARTTTRPAHDSAGFSVRLERCC